jgi:hypothetical protein
MRLVKTVGTNFKYAIIVLRNGVKSERKITFTRKELQNEIHWNFILNFFQVLFVPPLAAEWSKV